MSTTLEKIKKYWGNLFSSTDKRDTSLRDELPTYFAGLDIIPEFPRSTRSGKISLIISTMVVLVLYEVLSLVPVYGYTSSYSNWGVSPHLDESKAICLIKKLAMIPSFWYETVLSLFMVLPTNPRERNRVVVGAKVAAVIGHSLIRSPLTSTISPERIPLVSKDSLITRFLAGISTLLAGWLFLALERYAENRTMAASTRNLWLTADAVQAVLAQKYHLPRSQDEWLAIGFWLAVIFFVRYLDEISAWKLRYSRENTRYVRSYSCLELLKNAELSYRVCTGYIRNIVIEGVAPIIVTGLCMVYYLCTGNKEGRGLSFLQDLLMAIRSGPHVIISTSRHRFNGVQNITERYAVLWGEKLIYYALILPLLVCLSTEFSAEIYHPLRLVPEYLSRGCKISGQSHYGATINTVTREIDRLTMRSLLFIPIQLLMDSYYIYGKVDPSSIMNLLIRVTSLIEECLPE